MSEPATPQRVSFTEGSVLLPAGYEDRSTNLFVPANTQVQPNLNVARDWMKNGETLGAYLERQIALLKSQLAGHRVIDRRDEHLGAAASMPPPRAGLRIDGQYRNGKLTIHNRQAAFEVAPTRVLIFSASSPSGFGAAFETLWRDWLDSYRAAPEPPAAAG